MQLHNKTYDPSSIVRSAVGVVFDDYDDSTGLVHCKVRQATRCDFPPPGGGGGGLRSRLALATTKATTR
jgi:hypothetical protein